MVSIDCHVLYPAGARIRSATVASSTAPVLVVAAPPPLALAPQQGFLVASFGSAVEQLVEGVEDVGAAGVGRIDVVDDAVLERERAQPVALVPGVVLPAEVVLGAVRPL